MAAARERRAVRDGRSWRRRGYIARRERFSDPVLRQQRCRAFRATLRDWESTRKILRLTWLSKLDREKFQRLTVSGEKTKAEVETQSGCIVSREKLAAVIKQISDGNFDLFLQDHQRRTALTCEYSGALLRDFSGAIVQFKSDEMKAKATIKQDVDQSVKQIEAKGSVVLDLVVDADGHVVCSRTLVGIPILSRPIQEAVRHWTFAPAEQDGKSVGYTGLLQFALCNMSCGDEGHSMTIVK